MSETPEPAPFRDVSDVLREAWALYARNFRLLVMLVASVYVPIAIVSAGLSARLTPAIERVSQDLQAARKAGTAATGPGRAEIERRVREGQMSPEQASRAVDETLGRERAAVESVLRDLAGPGSSAAWMIGALLLLGFLLHGVGVPLCHAALTVAVTDRLTGGVLGFEEAWQVVVQRSSRLFAALVPSGLLVAVGLLFFLLPGLVLGYLFAFVSTVSILEGRGVSALRRSIDLVRADWQRVLILGIVAAFLRILAMTVGNAVAGDTFFGELLGHLVLAALVPLPGIGLVLLYLEQRRTREGVTVETLRHEARLDVTAPRATSPA